MTRIYSQTQISNLNAPQIVEAIDLTTDDYNPGYEFVVYVDDVTAGSTVKVDTTGGSTVTLTSAIEGTRLGGQTGIICTRVYRTGTTITTLLALRI